MVHLCFHTGSVVLWRLLYSKDVAVISNPYFILIIGIFFSAAFGYIFAIRVGGDMLSLSLLNSLSGVAGAAAGMAIGHILLQLVELLEHQDCYHTNNVQSHESHSADILTERLRHKKTRCQAGKTQVSIPTNR